MRLLHVTPSYYPATYWGGPIFSTYYLNNALAAIPEINLKVIATDAAGPRVADRLDPAALGDIYPNQMVRLAPRIAGASFSPQLIAQLPGLIRWAEVVHLTATYSSPTIPTLLLARLYRKPVVWSLRGAILELEQYQNVRKKQVKRLWNRVCNAAIRPGNLILHVTSAEEAQISQAEIPRAGFEIIKNGVNLPDQPPVYPPRGQGKFNLLFMGRLHPIKGLENLLAALKILADPQINCVICGTGAPEYTAQLQKLVADDPALRNQVEFKGHVTGAEKQNAFSQADVVIQPSFTENFGMAIAEGLAAGKPVIAAKGTPWQAVETYQCGLWVDNSPAALAEAIQTIRTADLEKLGYNGWQWMQREFSWTAIALQMAAVYRSLLA